MINPFKTKKILLISPNRVIDISIPFFGSIKYKVLNIEDANFRGEHYNGVVIDEIITLGKNQRYYMGIDFAKASKKFKPFRYKVPKNAPMTGYIINEKTGEYIGEINMNTGGVKKDGRNKK